MAYTFNFLFSLWFFLFSRIAMELYAYLKSPAESQVNETEEEESVLELPEEDYTVKMAIVITRHGDRTPTKIFPNTKSQWPEGLGQLTHIGMQQLQALGSKLRDRYVYQKKLLSPKLNINEIFVRSTARERTLISAQSFLLGLYPPAGDTLPTPTVPSLPKDPQESVFVLPLGFQPIPLYSSLKHTDDLLYAYKNCPRLKELHSTNVRSSPKWLQLENDPDVISLFDHLSMVFGTKLTFKHASSIKALIKAELAHGKETFLGEHITFEMLTKLEELSEHVAMMKFDSDEMGILAGGNLMKEIYRHLHAKSATSQHLPPPSPSPKPPTPQIAEPDYMYPMYQPSVIPKLVYYSAHDGTLLALFSALGLRFPHVPNYASHVIFELRYHPKKGDYVVMIYDDKLMVLPGAQTFECPIDEFAEMIARRFPEGWDGETSSIHDQPPSPEPEPETPVNPFIEELDYISNTINSLFGFSSDENDTTENAVTPTTTETSAVQLRVSNDSTTTAAIAVEGVTSPLRSQLRRSSSPRKSRAVAPSPSSAPLPSSAPSPRQKPPTPRLPPHSPPPSPSLARKKRRTSLGQIAQPQPRRDTSSLVCFVC
eukprot:TRINITY_DN2264_c0_g2_i1.p1 TRINITY_DN2264_c0_g2~~TRINITY_DN2264_c0_g2_i1.p1  ORF type:complete len:597 (-),score=88.82 TRINITY_DN2264_c0_g2_i1:161-1951(-)